MKKFIKSVVFVIMCLGILIGGIATSALNINVTPLPFDMNLLYGRNALAKMENGEELVAVYDTLLQGIQTAVTDENGYINVSFDYLGFFDIEVTSEELDVVLLPLRYDNPQLFWCDNNRDISYSYYLNGEDKIVVSVEIPCLYNTSTAEGKAALEKAKVDFDAAAEEFIVDTGVTKEMSEYEISLRLHDAVVKHVEYKEGSVNDHSAYGALIEGKSVCEGYAELYQYLLYLCGIQSHAVTGTAGEDHMWNLVRIDGEYYMSDPTWDDAGDDSICPTRYGYFNVTTERLDSESRNIDDNGYKLPECTATKDTYANHALYKGRAFTQEPSLQNAITQLKYNGEARFYYIGEGSYTLSDLRAWLNENNQENFRAIANEFGISSVDLTSKGNEFIIVAQGITTQDLPQIPNIPKIAAICSDTRITVKPNSVAGDVAMCPVESGTPLSTTDIQDLLNNTAVEVKGLVNGKVVTGSKLVFGGEEAVIAVKGDVDGDGELSVFDANIAQKGDSSFAAGDELQRFASDFDGNNVTDENDSQAIINQIVS